MTDKSTQMLKQATRDYLQWMKSMQSRGSIKLMLYGLVLVDFIDFVKHDYRLNVKITKYKCLSVKNKFVKYATGMTNFESVQLR